MIRYIAKRTLVMIPVSLAVSMIVFFIIQLPPGDFISGYAAKMSASGEVMDAQALAKLRENYGLDRPWYTQYFSWIWGILTSGDFGYSLSYNRPVSEIIGQYMGITVIISLATMIFTYVVAIPIGILSAVKKYSFFDYFATGVGFLGMATPNFLFAIILMFLSFQWWGDPMLGLFSPEFADAPWTAAKWMDLLKHMIIPVIVIGTSNTCELIRVMRGQMLDEMSKPHIVTARAKGLPEWKILLKYSMRAAVNPVISTIGWSLTTIFTGSTITAIVLNLPTQGPIMHRALLSQDMYLAGSWLLLMAIFTLIGTLLSDILLAWLDPRIRLDRKEA
ncbi:MULTISPECIES: ABC transporter permease [Paenibacillus]|uniref:ABC transporter permease n=1 Tax=Paenibacillus campinasensis TaxID=66347 RepID=A0A268EQM8_9BACL|nr:MULTISPECIES: ABC transporter permease [Paenibacillus]PAD75428.1 ABC transporter permease [Paenibacillus campinasensis]PAK51412.1 ABC transporter permease [Paenibacillus sp. 7541]